MLARSDGTGKNERQQQRPLGSICHLEYCRSPSAGAFLVATINGRLNYKLSPQQQQHLSLIAAHSFADAVDDGALHSGTTATAINRVLWPGTHLPLTRPFPD